MRVRCGSAVCFRKNENMISSHWDWLHCRLSKNPFMGWCYIDNPATPFQAISGKTFTEVEDMERLKFCSDPGLAPEQITINTPDGQISWVLHSRVSEADIPPLRRIIHLRSIIRFVSTFQNTPYNILTISVN